MVFCDSLPQIDDSTGFRIHLDTAYIPDLGVDTGQWDTGVGGSKGPVSAAAQR